MCGNITGNVFDFRIYERTGANFSCKWIIERNYSFALQFKQLDLGQYEFLCWSKSIYSVEKIITCGRSVRDYVVVDQSMGMLTLVFVAAKHKGGGGFIVEVLKIKNGKGETYFVTF